MHHPQWLTVLSLGLLHTACITGRDELAPEPPPAAPSTPAAAETAAPAPTPETAPPKVCSGAPSRAADGAVDDFEDGNGQLSGAAGRNGYWFTAKDDRGSLIEPTGNFTPADGGAAGAGKAALVKGKTAAVDGAWGATLGANFVQSGFYDLSKYAGVSFKIKASGPVAVRFKLPDVNTVPEGGVCSSGCWNAFGKDLSVTTEWQEVTVLFSELRQQDGWGDPRPPALAVNKVKGLEWAIDKGQEFELWIDDVHLLECK